MQLGTVYRLEDVEDVERLCRKLLSDLGPELQWWEIEDDLADLIGEVWILHSRWDAKKTPSFRQYVTWRLREHKIPDLARKYRGRNIWRFADRTHERERPIALSLDFPVGDGELRLGDTIASATGRGQADRGADLLVGLLDERRRQRSLDKSLIRQYGSQALAA